MNREELIEKINRVHAMKEKLLGKDYMHGIDDELMTDETIIDGYASADWFTYIDESNRIHIDYISEIVTNNKIIPYHQVDEAKEEMQHYAEILMNKYNLATNKGYAV